MTHTAAAHSLLPMTTPIASALPEDVLQELRRHNLLRTLVQRRVIAEAVADVSLSEEQRQQALQQFCQQNGAKNEEELAALLNSQGISADDLHWQVELPLRIQIHCNEHFRHKAEARFLERKNQLDRVVYSLLRVQDGFLARELYLRIAANEANFADLAARYAEGPEKGTKGIVGPVPLTQAHPALAEKLRTSSPGDLLEPFKISDWWLVVRLESYTPASFDEGMSAQMAAELFDQWVQEETALKIRAQLEHDQGTTGAAVAHGAEHLQIS
jgi:parvulin-like peptidyl-prolyl isomerase